MLLTVLLAVGFLAVLLAVGLLGHVSTSLHGAAMLGQHAALLGLDVGKFADTLLAVAYIGGIPIRRPTAEDSAHKECLQAVLACLEGNLRTIVAHAGDEEVAVVDEHFTVEPQCGVEGKELVNTVFGNVHEAFSRSRIVLDVAHTCRYLLYGAHTL